MVRVRDALRIVYMALNIMRSRPPDSLEICSERIYVIGRLITLSERMRNSPKRLRRAPSTRNGRDTASRKRRVESRWMTSHLSAAAGCARTRDRVGAR